uniref:Uncharacterized protein n=1 Tax=Rhizochromulina marina TaxID=1034831 RepID=A0A7S2RF09_9STRA|mmetsp:Transcript_15293/g.45304  ORF Transcript_15293/g.45304 Transcript_15293/m.45304 type:complete len:155 (+) Transcript_15293:117-581(+)
MPELSLKEAFDCQCSPDGTSFHGWATTHKHTYDIDRQVVEKDGSRYIAEGCGAHTRYTDQAYKFTGGWAKPFCYTIGGKDCSLNSKGSPIGGYATYYLGVCWPEHPYKPGDVHEVGVEHGDDCPTRYRECGERGALGCNVQVNNSVASGALLQW